MNTACEIGCRMWRSLRCGRATTLFAKLLKRTTVLVITSPKVMSVTVSQRHRQLSAARCGRATTLFAKLLTQTTVLQCSNYFTKSNLSVTVSQRYRHLSEEIFYDSLGIRIQIRGGANPRLGVRGFGSQHSTYRRHHSRGDRIQSKWRDPNPRLGSSKSASVFG